MRRGSTLQGLAGNSARFCQPNLNKGESHHSLKKAVFFNRPGELRDRTFENQSYRASGPKAERWSSNSTRCGATSKKDRQALGLEGLGSCFRPTG